MAVHVVALDCTLMAAPEKHQLFPIRSDDDARKPVSHEDRRGVIFAGASAW